VWWGICTQLCYKFSTKSNGERILKIGQYLVKLWALVRCLVFLTHGVYPFNGLFSRTTLVSQYQKGKTSLDLNKTRDDGVLGCSGIS